MVEGRARVHGRCVRLGSTKRLGVAKACTLKEMGSVRSVKIGLQCICVMGHLDLVFQQWKTNT